MSKNLPVTSRTIETDSSTAKLPFGNAFDGNDRVAFARLYDQYAPALFGIISRMVPDQDEAIALLEATFVQVRQQANQLPAPKGPLFVWLLSIARSTVLDFLNKQKQSSGPMLQLGKTGVVTPLALNRFAESPTVLNRSNPDTRPKELIDSVLFTKCTPDEVAASSGIPIEMARRQLRAAVQQLRALPTR